jgi:uncharacterized protein (TIGR00288 family)
MNPRNQRREPTRSHGALVHRGPQATAIASHPVSALPFQAPNAALLIDFDNVTMGIRSDLGHELRNLLGSDIIKGKVAVQRAYADWRRYPQYIVPLTEASIDLIFAPAYGSSKKNATDIRLAIDALELVFTRPEIGTFILLSGDSDFSSLVIKLKEYGKYVIGVGIRESSSDLLVMNCDEYYSYNALAGLVKAHEDEGARKYDPWELVTEAINRMERNGDVMRSDRLKQVMQDIDSSFDEKNTGHSKFSKFVQDAAARGLLTLTKLENGQLEIAPAAGSAEAKPAVAGAAPATEPRGERPGTGEERNGRRGRRGGRGRGRRGAEAPQLELASGSAAKGAAPASAPAPASATAGAGATAQGERLTRNEAFDLVRRAVETLTTTDEVVRASAVRLRAAELLGRGSESLSERNFTRILQDAHDANVVDLRRRGDDFEVSRAVAAAAVADQLAASAAAQAPAAAPAARTPRLGMGARGGASRGRARAGELPPELLAVGVVKTAAAAAPAPAPAVAAAEAPAASGEDSKPAPRKRGRKRSAKKAASASDAESTATDKATPRKAPRKRRTARKTASSDDTAKAEA